MVRSAKKSVKKKNYKKTKKELFCILLKFCNTKADESGFNVPNLLLCYKIICHY